MKKHVSIIIATNNRHSSLKRLLYGLSNQSYPSEKIEIIITDDGSKKRVTLNDIYKSKNSTKLITQDNKGQASARNRAILKSSGEIIIIIDDDMIPSYNLIYEHVKTLSNGADVSYGKIVNQTTKDLPSFEKYHLKSLNNKYKIFSEGITPLGTSLCTGNVAFKRSSYHKTRGFDETLKRSEDRDLGIQFQISGAKISFSPKAITTHKTDHKSANQWRHKSRLYGVYDTIISHKYADQKWASPWSFIEKSTPLIFLFSIHILTPKPIKRLLSKTNPTQDEILTWKDSKYSDLLASFIYPNEYLIGTIEQNNGRLNSLESLYRHLGKEPGPILDFIIKIHRDKQQSSNQRKKYQKKDTEKLPLLILNKVGFQTLFSVRIMQMANQSGLKNTSKIIGRMIRHIYGSDFHPETRIEGGISLVHGFGIVTSKDTKISKGCILFHNVTLGMGRNKVTGETGSPTIEENVHIGPGANITGPVRIGRNSKISAGSVVTSDIPNGSIVLAAKTTTYKKNISLEKQHH